MLALSLASTGQVEDGLQEVADELARAVSDGREDDVREIQFFRGSLLSIVLGAEDARAGLRDYIDADGLESISAGRDWGRFIELLAGVGLVDEASEVLASWERDTEGLAASSLAMRGGSWGHSSLARPQGRGPAGVA